MGYLSPGSILPQGARGTGTCCCDYEMVSLSHFLSTPLTTSTKPEIWVSFLTELRGRSLFRSLKFLIMLAMGTIATFPLFVPPFLLPLYITSIGLSSQTAAFILAAWNLASALGRIGMGFGADTVLGPLNSMFVSLTVIGLTAMALWPFANSLGLLIFFAILNGVGSGGFFSLMPVVVGAVFGDGELAGVMSVLTTSWTFGYFLVSKRLPIYLCYHGLLDDMLIFG